MESFDESGFFIGFRLNDVWQTVMGFLAFQYQKRFHGRRNGTDKERKRVVRGKLIFQPDG